MIETFSHPHLENCSSTIIMTRVKTKQNKTEMNKHRKSFESLHRWWLEFQHTYHISSPISQVILSVFDTKVWEIFSQEMGFSL